MAVTVKEAVYDAEIGPLMERVIDICRRAQISMVASFDISDREHPDFACTTAIGRLGPAMTEAREALTRDTIELAPGAFPRKNN